ncbi:MAG: desulfoferrodoxin [SAR202 cluster bacterium]|nr:desulfoferrodoxin [SAR202 cluster bacterium]
MASETGKRYVCGKCGSEFVATRGGDGDITCCDTPVNEKD